ncbi:unnamed protein product [Spirodela intermedia]|uniref:Uncharacterized protein n=1 Tax=Spirodela intermedia TaxID=51605 RepID=A0A7I8LLD2_SPIIN|nr:unnamed protein product [Spirodela intermedia]
MIHPAARTRYVSEGLKEPRGSPSGGREAAGRGGPTAIKKACQKGTGGGRRDSPVTDLTAM